MILDDENSESYIENKVNGVKIPLNIENGVYAMEMLVSSPADADVPSQGRAK